MDQLYRSSDVLAPAVNALLGELEGERRAARMRYAQSGPTGGRFGDILRGWQGQVELIRARLVKEVLATRLDSSSGQELKDLAKSEYFAEIPSDPRKAIGEAVIQRTIVNASSGMGGNFQSGVIPAGTRIKRTLEKAPRVPAENSEFVTTVAVPCGSVDSFGPLDNTDGTWTHTQQVTLPIEATREGPHANLPVYSIPLNPRTGTLGGSLFDPTFTVYSLNAAGGTLGVIDAQIRALARAMATGSWGPTGQAVIAGSLTSPSACHVAYVDDPASAVGHLFLADESWSSSNALGRLILQELTAYPWIGWGCRVRLSRVVNLGIAVQPTVVLRSRDYESATDDITANIVKALKSYFDDRPDWYTWTLNAIGAIVGAADDRILACTDALVLDSFGDSVDEPPTELSPTASFAWHYALIDQGATPIYQYPGG